MDVKWEGKGSLSFKHRSTKGTTNFSVTKAGHRTIDRPGIIAPTRPQPGIAFGTVQ